MMFAIYSGARDSGRRNKSIASDKVSSSCRALAITFQYVFLGSTAEAQALARHIWELYLGGTNPAYTPIRPFGRAVVLDGVDLDIQTNDPPELWASFVQTLRWVLYCCSPRFVLQTQTHRCVIADN